MDRLWSPWRFRYVSSASRSGAGRADDCIFCAIAADKDDQKNYVLLRAERNFVLLNRYPYTSGHLMIAPYAHVATLEAADPSILEEMMTLGRRAEMALRKVYNAPGFNLGLNIGEAAGAGVAGHIHMHVLPRWPGDASFMTTIAETRVLPEDLETTYQRLVKVF